MLHQAIDRLRILAMTAVDMLAKIIIVPLDDGCLVFQVFLGHHNAGIDCQPHRPPLSGFLITVEWGQSTWLLTQSQLSTCCCGYRPCRIVVGYSGCPGAPDPRRTADGLEPPHVDCGGGSAIFLGELLMTSWWQLTLWIKGCRRWAAL